MQNLKALLLLFLPFLLPLHLQGQSLAEDTRALVSALRAMGQAQDTSMAQMAIPSPDTISADTTLAEMAPAPGAPNADSSVAAAAGEALAILYYYDNPGRAGEFTEPQLQAVIQRYRENPLMQEPLSAERLSLLEKSNDAVFVQAFRNKLTTLRQAPRHKMMQRLYSEDVLSPSVYLSVSRSLERYSRPAVSNVAMLKRAAQGSNRNVSQGIVSAPDIIQGLFTFILERAQEEVAINFLERLLGEEVQLLDELFPTVAGTFDGQNFTYSNSFIDRLRQSFYEDMQMIPVRLPELMLEADYFQSLRDDPVAYNLFVVFTMSGMGQKGMSLDEILPVTNRYLFDNYGEARKAVNFYLAKNENAYRSAEYDSLVAITERILQNLWGIHNELASQEKVLRDSIRAFQRRFPDAPGILGMDRELRNPDYDVGVLLSGKNDSLGLGLQWLPDMLRGQLSENAVLQYNSIENYDKFFGQERSAEQWRAAGLELARSLNGNWHKGNAMDGILRKRLAALTGFRLQIEQWKTETDSIGALNQAISEAEAKRLSLITSIGSTAAYWGDSLSRDQGLALQLLQKIAEDFRAVKLRYDRGLVSGKEYLEMMSDRILQIEQRLFALNKKLSDEYPDKEENSPVLDYQRSQQPFTPYAHIGPMIDTLADNLSSLQLRLHTLENARAGNVIKARDNAEPLLQLTEVATQLAYGLRSADPDKKWIGREELMSLLNGGLEQQVFLGLLQQRLLDIPSVGRFSPQGLSQLIDLTIQDLPVFIDSTGQEKKDSLAFYYKASFVVNTFNRILELPLMQKPGSTGEFAALVKQNPKLAQLPALSNQSLDLIYYLSRKDHRHAVSSSIRLFSTLDEAIVSLKDKKKGKQGAVIRFFRNYGDFVADLIDAESGTQVQGLMNSIADPPGSARAKRRQDFTVAINAYLGASFGFESWEQPESNITEEFWSLAPTMPLGISISKLLGKKREEGPERRPSFTAFLSFLDLGGLLTYRSTDKIDAETVFSFKNVFKPGLQLHVNPRNTPFYFGVGGHFGSQFLDSGGEEVSVRAARGFVAFGIDVPVKTLYQK